MYALFQIENHTLKLHRIPTCCFADQIFSGSDAPRRMLRQLCAQLCGQDKIGRNRKITGSKNRACRTRQHIRHRKIKLKPRIRIQRDKRLGCTAATFSEDVCMRLIRGDLADAEVHASAILSQRPKFYPSHHHGGRLRVGLTACKTCVERLSRRPGRHGTEFFSWPARPRWNLARRNSK